MDINKEAIEKIKRKSLGEDCWITVGDEIKIKIDYLTRAQEMEFNRLSLSWNINKGQGTHSHHLEYYFRCAVKDVQGITIEGADAVLTFKDGLARDLVKNNLKDHQPLDLVSCFLGLGLFETALFSIYEKLELTEADKKKLQSAQDSVKTESSQTLEVSSSPAQS